MSIGLAGLLYVVYPMPLARLGGYWLDVRVTKLIRAYYYNRSP